MNLAELPSDPHIAVIGLGYVGMPLALEFSKHYPVLGFDIKCARIDELNRAEDSTKEAEPAAIQAALDHGIRFSCTSDDLAQANVYIVTVHTPINASNATDLNPLLSASKTIGGYLKKGDVVVYESTTYPGCTEEDCVPVLEAVSGLTFNQDFYCGYSP